MANTPAWLIILSGLIISGMSYYIGERFMIFFYIGLVFIVYGLIKWYIVKDTKLNEDKEKLIRQETAMIRQQRFSYCRTCGAVIRQTDNFCYKCGYKLR